MIFIDNIDLNQYQLQNAVLQPLATAPLAPKLGQIYCNSSTGRIMWYNGASWQVVGVVVESSETNGNIKVDGIEMSVYELPKATADILGGVKIGTRLTVDANGVLSANVAAWGDISGKPSTFPPSTHNHDDRYYTETETDTKLATKVDKVAGKDLSTNDYTTVEKNKLAAIQAGAEVNVNADWNASSGDANILNKPTKLSDFTNDSAFITKAVNDLTNYYVKSDTYTKTEVNGLIGNLQTIQIQVVVSLPPTGASNVIYLVAKTPAGGTGNIYDEYIWINSTSKFEKIGDTEIDLSNYLTKTGAATETTVGFTVAGSRTLPATGEKLSVIMGKIVKYFTDLKTVAFSGSYTDLTNQPTLVKTVEATLATTETTKTLSYSGKFISCVIKDTTLKEIVFCNTVVNANSVVVTLPSVWTNPLLITVSYI